MCFVEYINYFCNRPCFVQFVLIHLIFQTTMVVPSSHTSTTKLSKHGCTNNNVPILRFSFWFVFVFGLITDENMSVPRPLNYWCPLSDIAESNRELKHSTCSGAAILRGIRLPDTVRKPKIPQSHKSTYVYLMFIGPCIIVIVKNKRPTWCHLLFYFTSYVLNMFRTLIYPSSGACDYSVQLPHWSYCSWFDVCRSYGVVGLEWYPCCRLQPANVKVAARTATFTVLTP